MPGLFLDWIEEFLKNRSQRVHAVVDGEYSEQGVISEVPHGSALEPILFLAFITHNDMPEHVKVQDKTSYVLQDPN